MRVARTELLGCAFFPLSLGLREKVPLIGIIVLVLTSVSGKVLRKESRTRTPFLKRGKQVKTGWGKAPCLDWDVPKALFEDLISSLCQEKPFQSSRHSSPSRRGEVTLVRFLSPKHRLSLAQNNHHEQHVRAVSIIASMPLWVMT